MYLRTKFQISSIILTHFRQDGGVAGGEGGGGNFTLPLPQQLKTNP